VGILLSEKLVMETVINPQTVEKDGEKIYDSEQIQLNHIFSKDKPIIPWH